MSSIDVLRAEISKVVRQLIEHPRKVGADHFSGLEWLFVEAETLQPAMQESDTMQRPRQTEQWSE